MRKDIRFPLSLQHAVDQARKRVIDITGRTNGLRTIVHQGSTESTIGLKTLGLEEICP